MGIAQLVAHAADESILCVRGGDAAVPRLLWDLLKYSYYAGRVHIGMRKASVCCQSVCLSHLSSSDRPTQTDTPRDSTDRRGRGTFRLVCTKVDTLII